MPKILIFESKGLNVYRSQYLDLWCTVVCLWLYASIVGGPPFENWSVICTRKHFCGITISVSGQIFTLPLIFMRVQDPWTWHLEFRFRNLDIESTFRCGPPGRMRIPEQLAGRDLIMMTDESWPAGRSVKKAIIAIEFGITNCCEGCWCNMPVGFFSSSSSCGSHAMRTSWRLVLVDSFVFRKDPWHSQNRFYVW